MQLVRTLSTLAVSAVLAHCFFPFSAFGQELSKKAEKAGLDSGIEAGSRPPVSSSSSGSSASTYYRQIHMNPELGKEEFETAEFIRKELSSFGYKDLLSISEAPTCVIATVEGAIPGPTICFRADMDARKTQEKTGLSFASKKPGLMHNCGHDAHTAILLETAKQLMAMKAKLRGKIVLLFQPAEECAGGANDVVASGILEKLKVENLYALHCASRLPVGEISLASGPCLASSNTLRVKLSGKGGHAAQVQERDDLVRLAALLILELEALPSRCVDIPNQPALCAITNISSNSEQANVAPDTVELGGTVRTFFNVNEKLFRGKSYIELTKQLLDGFAQAWGVSCELDWKEGVPVTVNDEKLAAKMRQALTESGLKVVSQGKGMFAEDFAYYTQKIPSCYFGLGIEKDGKGSQPPHSALFTLHEDSLEQGVQLFLSIARKK